jgi:hypothetical protein
MNFREEQETTTMKREPAIDIPARQCRQDRAVPGARRLIATFLILSSLIVWGGCSGDDPNALGGKSSPLGASPAQISASPNPVPAGPDKGTTTITWSAGEGKTGEVYLVTRDGTEKLFGGHARKGSQKASFIRADWVYEFRLYEGKEHAKVLASVKVTREKGNP